MPHHQLVLPVDHPNFPLLARESLRQASGGKFTVASLFSGCGGMDLGFRGGFEFLGRRYNKNPFEILWANDLNESACKTYADNIGQHIVCGDIWQRIEEIPIGVDVVIGGFPCQDISVNGKGLGVNGSRSGLYRAMVDVVDKVRPQMFIAENVKGLLMRHNEKSLERVLRDFRAIGYNVSYQLYLAADFGVPQTRERVFIVGTLPGGDDFAHPKGKQRHISAHEAIDDLASRAEDPAFSHIWSRAKKSLDQGGRSLKADRPGYTVRAECHGNIHYHYRLQRRMSMREAARVQSFPDDFLFAGGLRQTERQIGNAVPPVLAWHLARAVRSHLLAAEKNVC